MTLEKLLWSLVLIILALAVIAIMAIQGLMDTAYPADPARATEAYGTEQFRIQLTAQAQQP